MTPVCTIMVGRLDDWMKVLVERDEIAVDPTVLDWAGIAAFKRAYEIFHGTRLSGPAARRRLPAPAALDRARRRRRHLDHDPSVAGDASTTAASTRFPRIQVPVDGPIVNELSHRLPGLPPGLRARWSERFEQFESFGATVRTLRSFIKSYHDLIGAVRDVVLPDPDSVAERPRPVAISAEGCGGESERRRAETSGPVFATGLPIDLSPTKGARCLAR